MSLSIFDHYPLALAVIAFIPAYLAGTKLEHRHAAPLAGFAASFVVYLAAKALLALALYVVLPALLIVLCVRFADHIRHWGQVFASESGVRLRHFRRPYHVNDAIDRLLDRRDIVTRELTDLKSVGGNRSHVEQRLRQELQTLDRTLEDLL
jgi:hypothetical protein